MADSTFNKVFDDLESKLQELAKELTVASGIVFEEDKSKRTVKPKDEKEARLLERGSATLGRSPKPFFDTAVDSFLKKTGIKRG